MRLSHYKSLTETDGIRSQWPADDLSLKGKKHKIFTSRTSFFFPGEDLSHTASKSRFEHQKVCLHESRSSACVCSWVTFVFSVKKVNESMQMSMVWYSRGEILSLFAMCDYVKANFRVTHESWGVMFWISVPWDVGLNKMSHCCLSPQQEGDICFCFKFMGKYWESTRSPATHGFHTVCLCQLYWINWLTLYGNCREVTESASR